jgi:type IV pilus assembly protein PilP
MRSPEVFVRIVPALALLLLAGCSSAPSPSAVASSQASLASPLPAPPSEGSGPAGAHAPRAPIALDALVEGPESRDPFQAFTDPPAPPPADTRPRKAHRIPVDQLKLVALVTHTATPRALLVDPAGKGYIVTQGELVGRPEPDGERLASFRVDRIREGDVVLVREDGAGRAGATRVLAIPRVALLQAED